jgi:hypothetical protein
MRDREGAVCAWFTTRKQQQRRLEEQIAANRWDFEQAVSKIYKYDRITLALAEIAYFEGYNFKREGVDLSQPDHHALVGVVHEYDSQYDVRISCEVAFSSGSYSGGSRDNEIGWCVLSSGPESRFRNAPALPQRNKHSLEVHIGDPGLQCWSRLWAGFQAAAASQLRFMHVELVTACAATMEAASREIEEKGYGPTKAVTAIKMWPKIVLPNAPQWALRS